MYSLGDFPFAIRTDESADKMLVEVFEIENAEVRMQIDQLEHGYGYHKETIEKANYPKVNEGDWVKFFRG